MNTECTITVDAKRLAVAWLNAALAMGDDEDRPVLYKTLAIEWFQGVGLGEEMCGLQCVGCDGSLVVRTWVPRTVGDDWPAAMGMSPFRKIVVMDREGFAKGFMSTLKASVGDEYEPLVARIGWASSDAQPALGTEYEPRVLTLTAMHQTISLPLMAVEYPDWRKLNLGVAHDERVETLTFAPRMFKLLGQLKEVDRIDLAFVGEELAVAVTGWAGVLPCVQGIVMPMRRPGDRKAGRSVPAVDVQVNVDPAAWTRAQEQIDALPPDA